MKAYFFPSSAQNVEHLRSLWGEREIMELARNLKNNIQKVKIHPVFKNEDGDCEICHKSNCNIEIILPTDERMSWHLECLRTHPEYDIVAQVAIFVLAKS